MKIHSNEVIIRKYRDVNTGEAYVITEGWGFPDGNKLFAHWDNIPQPYYSWYGEYNEMTGTTSYKFIWGFEDAEKAVKSIIWKFKAELEECPLSDLDKMVNLGARHDGRT